MGGICGIQYLKSAVQADDRIISTMLDIIQHRGRQINIFSTGAKGSFGVGWPETMSEVQWFAHDTDRKLSVILDGEIFNLSDANIPKGNSFSDAEVILNLYSKYADKFVDKIDGSYAIAIWDELKERLLLVRDRVGSKPLFYCIHNGLIVFASEIKAILASKFAKKSVNLRSLNNFLSLRLCPKS